MCALLGAAATFVLAACGDGDSVSSEAASTSTDTTPSTTETSASDESGSGGAQCTALFGRPTDATGLSDSECAPQCPCLDGWVAPTYDASDVARLRGFTLLDPPPPLDEDPYASPDEVPPVDPEAVCAVMLDGDDRYRLETFASDSAAERAGGQVTHAGGCGRCSPLADLAVYIEQPDLTEPVRACGLLGLSEGPDAILECLLDLGFTMPCAQIWQYNTMNTSAACLDPCLEALDQPYHLPDGSLNACLQCDEDMSGPVFKPVAGRTRRNTGLASALCRPCDQVQRIVHDYG